MVDILMGVDLIKTKVINNVYGDNSMSVLSGTYGSSNRSFYYTSRNIPHYRRHSYSNIVHLSSISDSCFEDKYLQFLKSHDDKYYYLFFFFYTYLISTEYLKRRGFMRYFNSVTYVFIYKNLNLKKIQRLLVRLNCHFKKKQTSFFFDESDYYSNSWD